MENIKSPDYYNTAEKAGKELECNCLGFINDKKYLSLLKEKLELLELIKRNFGYYDHKNPEHKKYLKFFKRMKKENEEKYNDLRDEIADKINYRLAKTMNNKHKYLILIEEDEVSELIEMVEESQINEGNKTEPNLLFARDLHEYLAQELNLEDYNNLEFHTSTNTHIDACSVDGWFKYSYKDDNGQERDIRIMFDLTSKTLEQKLKEYREKRREGGKILSNLILSMPGQETYRPSKDREIVAGFAKDIKKEIDRRIKL
jgi:hypothetical protein